MRLRSPELLWRSSIWMHQHHLRLLAKCIKVLNYLCHRALLPAQAIVGKRITLEHYALGIVIHPNVTIGDDCRIYHHVTIAGEVPIDAKERVVIGDRVVLGVNAVILPRPYCGLFIGDDAIIGAGAVVTSDVPARAVVVGVPGKVIRIREASELKNSIATPTPSGRRFVSR